MNKRNRKKGKNQSMKQRILEDLKNDNDISAQTDKDSDKVIHLFIEPTRSSNTLEYAKLFISILIAAIGFILTMRSNAIYKMQKEIQEKQISPAIDISVTLKEEFYGSMNEIIDKLTVHNVGGIAEHIDCYVRPFFLVYFREVESGEEGFSDAGVVIPIRSFTVPVMANESIGLRSGEIARIYANENLLYLADTIRQWEFYGIDPKIFRISIGYFLKIDYQDLFQKEWTEYYSCFPGYNVTYGKFPDMLGTAFGVTKIAEEDDAIDIVKTCFAVGGTGETVGEFIYENGASFDENYIQFFNLFSENYDKNFYYNIPQSGEFDPIEFEDFIHSFDSVK